jgi:hypothetical protein
MTAPRKALIRYGLLTAGALVCAALAALGEFRMSPLLAGRVKSACQVAVAIAMAIQGAALFPRSWPSRLLVKPHALAAGSLILFAGATLILVLLFAGCNPARAKLAATLPTSTEFTAANEQFRGARFAHTPLGALMRTCCRDDAKDKADRLPSAALLGFRSLERSLCGFKNPASMERWEELTAALNQQQK